MKKKLKINKSNLDFIPSEIVAIIASYCTSMEWYSIKRTCKLLNEKSDEDIVLESIGVWYIYQFMKYSYIFHHQKYVKNLVCLL